PVPAAIDALLSGVAGQELARRSSARPARACAEMRHRVLRADALDPRIPQLASPAAAAARHISEITGRESVWEPLAAPPAGRPPARTRWSGADQSLDGYRRVFPAQSRRPSQ